nr:hypothetical protein BRADI_2g47491v3 [Ipomoea batatas]
MNCLSGPPLMMTSRCLDQERSSEKLFSILDFVCRKYRIVGEMGVRGVASPSIVLGGLRSVAGLVRLGHGEPPVAISMTVHPNAQISAGNPCSFPCATSGAMNNGVPPIAAAPASEIHFEHPKSPILAPLLPNKIFPPLISQCTIPLQCKYTSPCTISFVYRPTANSSSRPPRLTASATAPPGINSITTLNIALFSSHVTSHPLYSTICGQFKVEKIRCSLCKNSDFESSTDLTAKISPDCRQVATDTAAEEPWPMVLPLIQLILNVEKKTFLVFGWFTLAESFI